MSHDNHPVSDTGTPWQLWVVIVLLAVEGVGNLFAIPSMPIAGLWLATKILSIAGLIRRWRIVLVLFVVVVAFHVLEFAVVAPFVAFLNLLILILVISQFRKFFPLHDSRQYNQQASEVGAALKTELEVES